MRKFHLLIAVVFILSGSVTFGAVQRTAVPIGDSPSFGPADAPVTIIEFIDFQ